MSLTSLINLPCVIKHRTGGTEVNGSGDEVPEVVEIDTVCELQQQARREDSDEIADTRWVAYFLPGERVGVGDELVVDGVTFQVEGDPWNARSPLARKAHHVEASLRRTSGAAD